MDVTVDVVLRGRSGQTIIDVSVDEVQGGVYRTVWDLRTSLEQDPLYEAEQPQAWICVALRHLLAALDCDHVVDQADELAAAAAPTPAETTLDLGELPGL